MRGINSGVVFTAPTGLVPGGATRIRKGNGGQRGAASGRVPRIGAPASQIISGRLLVGNTLLLGGVNVGLKAFGLLLGPAANGR